MSVAAEPEADPARGATRAFVTASIAGQLFGIPLERARDVFRLPSLTPVPLAPPDVLGLMNLRGRVVTALDVRRRLGAPAGTEVVGAMAIGIEAGGEPFGLAVDTVGEIVTVGRDDIQPNPLNLDPAWAALSRGVFGLADELFIVLDIDTVVGAGPVLPNPSHASESAQ